MWRYLVVASILILLAGSGAMRLERLDRPGEGMGELSTFPSGRLLGLLSMGQPTLLADLTWLAAIQYYGKHHMGDRLYPLAQHLFVVTTQIDPKFRSAYIFGGLILADEVKDLDAARAFFTMGVRANPDDWTLAFQRGFIEYMRGDRSIGASLMVRASGMSGAEPYAARLAAYACGRVGRVELAIRLWEEMAGSPDPALRALAEERLRDLRAGDAAR